MRQKPKDLDADVMRVLAAFFVVVIHVAASSGGVVYNCIARFSVPVFVILSGRYMLARKRSIPSLLKKNAHFLLLMVCWSAVFYLVNAALGLQPEEPVWVYLLTQPVHLWYLWACAALYLLVPVLYVFCTHADQRVYGYFLLLAFLCGSVLTILLRIEMCPVLGVIVEKMKLPYQLGFVFCFLLGDYLRRFPVEKRTAWKAGAVLLAAGTAGTVLGTLVLFGEEANWPLMSFFSPTVLCAAVGFYLMFQAAAWDRIVKGGAWIHRLARATLGVYLLHPLLVELLWAVTETRWSGLRDGNVLLLAALVFLLSALAVMILQKIPVLRKLVT